MNISDFIPVGLKTQAKRLVEPNQAVSDEARARDLQIREKSREIEGLFLTHMIKSMEKTIPKNMSGSGQNMATMMFSSVMGEAMSKGEGMGLSKMIYQSLKEKDGSVDTDSLKALELMDNMHTNSLLKIEVDE